MNMLLKILFEAATKTNPVSFDNISDEYNFISFEVKSLFTNVNIKYINVNRVTGNRKLLQYLIKDHLKSYY